MDDVQEGLIKVFDENPKAAKEIVELSQDQDTAILLPDKSYVLHR